jgi:hypothetical protein
MFYFNHQAKYQGKWYNLQPLGTEGQGIAGKKYKRLQPELTLGTGWNFKAGNSSYIGFEVAIKITRTDYIDDVSGQYFDKASLNSSNGKLAAILSDRSGDIAEYYNPDYVPDPYSESGYRHKNYGAPGLLRGNPKNFDKFIIYNLTFTHYWGRKFQTSAKN